MEGRGEEGVESRQVISWNSTSRLFSQNQERMRSSIWSTKSPFLDPPLHSAYLAAAYPGCRKKLVSSTSIAFTTVKGLYKKLTRRALALLQSKSRDCGLYVGCTSNGGAMVLVGTC